MKTLQSILGGFFILDEKACKARNMEYNIFMTKVVKKNKEVKGAKPRTILDNIADSLKRGANYEAYDKEIDKILGTEMQERDLEAEEAFELNNRRNDDPIS